jgi:hypothetical protein
LSLRTHAGLTLKALATSLVGRPASQAAITRSRKSIEYAFMPPSIRAKMSGR